MQEVRPANSFRSEIRLMLQGAMVIFLVTVIIGILNGLNLVEFTRPTLLTHVHAGTLGWITLGFFAACLWLFSEGQTVTGWRAWSPRPLSWAAAVAIAFYVIAFYSGNLTARLIGGILTLIAIVGFFVWVVAQSRRVRLSTPHLAVIAALATRARRPFWPWADHVLFWGMNVGVLGFVVGLIMQEAIIKQVFTPIMGASILLAILTYTVRLQTRAAMSAPASA